MSTRPIVAIKRQDLSVVANELSSKATESGFIGSQILKDFPTKNRSSDYPIIPRESYTNIYDTTRAPGASYRSIDGKFETGLYTAQDHGLKEQIDDTERSMFAHLIDQDMVATRRVTIGLLRAKEKRTADVVNLAGNAGATAAASAVWSNQSGADPKLDIATGKATMFSTFGIIPDTVVISKTAFDHLLQTDSFAEQTKYTGSIQMGTFEVQLQMAALYLGVSRVLVPGGVYNSANLGQDAVLAEIWDTTKVHLLQIGNSPMDLKEPTFGRSFRWTLESPARLMIDTYRDEDIRSDIYRVRNYESESVVSTACNYALTGVLS